MIRTSVFAMLLSMAVLPNAIAQIQPSNTLQRTKCTFQDRTVATMEYDPMLRNGRKTFGGIVPYGQVWMTGDKHAPTLTTDTNLIIGGKEVPVGRYSIATIPNLEKWTLIVKKFPSEKDLKSTEEVARIDLTVRQLSAPLEIFAISFDQAGGGCVLNLRWEKTEASVLLAEKK